MTAATDDQLSYTEHLDGSKAWRLNAQYHRADGPALIWPSGAESWYWHGQMHRDGGPASTDPQGLEQWYRHGKRHREDGPAIILADGSRQWYLEDRQLSEKEFRDWQDAQRRQAGFNVAAGVQKTDHPVTAPATAKFRARQP
jgi:hypothetical protein